MSCWSCQSALTAGVDTCPRCGKLQPLRTGDYFAYLGLPRSYHVDPERLSEILRERSRTLHPDRYARASDREKALSLQHTTLLNDAVRTLRDPQKRAEYLLSLYGLKAGATERTGAKMEPGFLMEMMETREALADALKAKDAAKLEKIKASATTERQSLLSAAEARFSEWEKQPEDKKPLEAVVPLLDKARYFDQIVAEASGSPHHG